MITAPYRFVPLNKKVVIPHFEPVSHDKPYKEGEDGIVVVKLSNETPLFIRNGEGIKNANEYLYPEFVNVNGQKQYFIPSTSWQGMVRSVMEIMTFARLSNDQYNNRTYSEREINKNFLKKMSNLVCGWLYMNDDGHYCMMYCGDIRTIKIKDIPVINGVTYNSVRSSNIIGKLAGYEMRYPQIPNSNEVLVFTGEMKGKEHEYLFPIFSPSEMDIHVTDTIVKNFFEAYKDSPYNSENDKNSPNFIEEWLKQGKALPVFYQGNKNTINRIGFTKIHRVLKPYSIADGVRNGQEDTDGLDFVQRIMGYVDGNDALKGRVQFSHSKIGAIPESQLISTEGILGEPKASYYPLYLANQKNYSDPDLVIAGRKRYVIHEQGYQVGFPAKDEMPDNESVRSRILLLPSNLDMELRIRFHNLLPEELGALLSALTFHNTQGLYHSIGMAKAYGYGKLQINSVELQGTTQTDINYYMLRFEKYMNNALKPTKWAQSEQIIALARYATPQSSGLKVMELSEFSKQKEGSYVAELKNIIPIETLYTRKSASEVSTSSTLPEVLVLTSAGAFLSSIKRIKNAQDGNIIDEQFAEIKEQVRNLYSEWTDLDKKLKDIKKQLGEERTRELFSND